jgi:hypothetical protein
VSLSANSSRSARGSLRCASSKAGDRRPDQDEDEKQRQDGAQASGIRSAEDRGQVAIVKATCDLIWASLSRASPRRGGGVLPIRRLRFKLFHCPLYLACAHSARRCSDAVWVRSFAAQTMVAQISALYVRAPVGSHARQVWAGCAGAHGAHWNDQEQAGTEDRRPPRVDTSGGFR